MMTEYTVRNTSRAGKSYVAENGHRLSYAPGEEKDVASLPPEFDDPKDEVAGWEVQTRDQDEGGEQ